MFVIEKSTDKRINDRIHPQQMYYLLDKSTDALYKTCSYSLN